MLQSFPAEIEVTVTACIVPRDPKHERSQSHVRGISRAATSSLTAAAQASPSYHV
jgi:hypothetical protein